MHQRRRPNLLAAAQTVWSPQRQRLKRLTVGLTLAFRVVAHDCHGTAFWRAWSQLLLIVMMLVLLLGQAGCRQNSTRPGVIVGGSMAPTLLGSHYRCRCARCDFEFACDSEQAASRPSLVCPNCGNPSVSTQGLAVTEPDAVNVAGLVKRDPLQRFEIIAFKRAADQAFGVKRVVGLPGETIRIEHGNLWLGEELIRKPEERKREMRVLVHDTAHTSLEVVDGGTSHAVEAPTPERRLDRWLPLTSPQSTRQRHDEIDQSRRWIAFVPRRCYSQVQPPSEKEEEAPPIEDNYGYNQSVSRSPNPTDELWMELNLASDSHATNLAVAFDFRGTVYRLDLDRLNNDTDSEPIAGSASQYQATLSVAMLGDDLAKPLQTLPTLSRLPETLEISTIDAELVVRFDGSVVSRINLPLREKLRAGSPIATRPLRLSAIRASSAASLKKTSSTASAFVRARIWRDVYYEARPTALGNLPVSQTLTAAASEYILLGDNVPISADSRHWQPPGVAASEIEGRVKRLN